MSSNGEDDQLAKPRAAARTCPPPSVPPSSSVAPRGSTLSQFRRHNGDGRRSVGMTPPANTQRICVTKKNQLTPPPPPGGRRPLRPTATGAAAGTRTQCPPSQPSEVVNTGAPPAPRSDQEPPGKHRRRTDGVRYRVKKRRRAVRRHPANQGDQLPPGQQRRRAAGVRSFAKASW